MERQDQVTGACLVGGHGRSSLRLWLSSGCLRGDEGGPRGRQVEGKGSAAVTAHVPSDLSRRDWSAAVDTRDLFCFILAGGSGKRMLNKAGMSKHMQPVRVGNDVKPLLGFVIGNLEPLMNEIVVGTAYRAATTEKYLRRNWPCVRTFRLPRVDDLGVNVVAVCTALTSEFVCFVYGDVLISSPALGLLFEEVRSSHPSIECPLVLLLERQRPNPQRSTYDVEGRAVCSVRACTSEDPWRYSTLATVVHRSSLINLLEAQGAPYPYHESAVTFTFWPVLARRILRLGISVRAIVSPTPSFNVNTREDLEDARRYLETHAA